MSRAPLVAILNTVPQTLLPPTTASYRVMFVLTIQPVQLLRLQLVRVRLQAQL